MNRGILGLLAVILCCDVLSAADTVKPCRAKDPDDPRPRIGLVLGGGGARGIAHVSVLKALEAQHIPVDCVAGTSMGALIGGLYASGMPAVEIETLLLELNWNGVLTDSVARKERSFRRKQDDLESLAPAKPGIGKGGLKFPSGLIAGENIRLFLERHTGRAAAIRDFDALPIPFRAVATDINSGEEVLLSSGNLALAMRASMSIPGIFNPVSIGGRLLVDGGLVNQVPVDVARAMGADILVVVDVGTPLQPIAADSNALQITDQVMSFMTVGNTRAQLATLGPRDVLIQPEFNGTVTTAAFDKVQTALDIGTEAVRASSSLLAALPHASGPVFSIENRDAQTRIAFVELINRTTYDDQVFINQLKVLRGKPIDRDAIDARMRAVYGQHPLELVSYEVIKRGADTGLVVTVTPPLVGRNFGEFGLNFSGNTDGQFLFNITAGMLTAPLNPSGGELRTLLTLGDSPAVSSAWYQPFSPTSPFFSEIKLGYGKPIGTISDDDGNILAEYSLPNFFLNARIGRSYGNWGELSLFANLANGKLSREIGEVQYPQYDFNRRELGLGYKIDTLDSLYLPRSGFALDAQFVGAMPAWGADSSYQQVNLDMVYAHAIGRHSGFVGLRYHDSIDGSGNLQNFYPLGGVSRFAGYQPEQRFAENYGLLFLGYTYELGKLLNRSLVIGSTLEHGRIWFDETPQFDITGTHGSLYFGFDSWIGLLIMGYGRSDSGDSNVFFELGRTR